jgi:hypothetical protein
MVSDLGTNIASAGVQFPSMSIRQTRRKRWSQLTILFRNYGRIVEP